MGEFLRARITPEMAGKLEQMILETKEVAPIADISMASIARHAIEECIAEYENKKTHEEFRFKTSNMKSTENLELASDSIRKLKIDAELKENYELSSFYEALGGAISNELWRVEEMKRLRKEIAEK